VGKVEGFLLAIATAGCVASLELLKIEKLPLQAVLQALNF
jgi:hypothetical protein